MKSLVVFGALLLLLGRPAMASQPASASVPLNLHILVDQFGYRPGDSKVAVIRDPIAGFDKKDTFLPGKEYELRRADSGKVVFSAAINPWKGGAEQPSSGDRGWWFVFSSVDEPGSYFVYDSDKKVRSPVFRIDKSVYARVLREAVRTYFYQRSGMEKRPPYAAACWTDAPAYMGSGQDVQARDITDPANPRKFRDLNGGWFDAGDTNKYVTNATPAVHQLLTAYQEAPAVFTDDFDIPESGNGIPDLLDEVNWEIAWLKKMQHPDGSVALKVGETVYASASPPSADHNERFYVPSCTSSTIVAAGMFAHAAYVFQRFAALSTESADLKSRAIKAWNNFVNAPKLQEHCDSGAVHMAGADLNAADQEAEAATAAIYLYAVTGDPAYQSYVEANYKKMRPYQDIGWSRYKPEQGEALLFYSSLPSADSKLRAEIRNDKLEDVRKGGGIYAFSADADLYRAYLNDAQYHWGSNGVRANYGTTNLDVTTYGVVKGDAETYRERALGILHYFHGVNPFGMVYLTNMYADGATNSVNEIYHSWFAANTKWSDARTSPCGPPPGFLPGGPNGNAVQDGLPADINPPAGQPLQKSYRDWNGGSPQNSWVVSEPGIYYQSAYIELLARLAQ